MYQDTNDLWAKVQKDQEAYKGNIAKCGDRLKVPGTTLNAKWNEFCKKVYTDLKVLVASYLTSIHDFASDEDREEMFKKVYAFVEGEKHTMTKIWHMAMDDGDILSAVVYSSYAMANQVALKFYADYWVEHCIRKEGAIFNDLIGMWWSPSNHIWAKKEGPIYSAAIKLPPTKEAIEERAKLLARDAEDFEKEYKKRKEEKKRTEAKSA